MRLFINEILIELEEGNPIAITKQVNDIANLQNRENDRTQKIKAPFTPNNHKALDYLTTPGSNSQFPYKKNVAKLFTDAGEPLIYKGFATINNTGTSYEVVIYEGIISFWKKIENITLKDVGIAELNHLKNTTTIVASWNNALKYRYLLADYNGKFLTTTGNLNADYLVPSALVSYLWQQVFNYAGYIAEGSIFQELDFTELFLTYPKPVGGEEVFNLVYDELFEIQSVDPFSSNGPDFYNTFYFPNLLQKFVSNIYAQSIGTYNEIIEIQQGGLYRFNLNGTINFPQDETAIYSLYYWVNDPLNKIEIVSNITALTQLDLFFSLTLQLGDKIYLGFDPSNIELGISNLQITINNVEGDTVDFEEAFIDFKVTDFVKEIMNRFGLTPFADKFQDKILFLTEEERYLQSEVKDWSNKFINLNSTKYQIGYARKNNFIYKYADDNQNFNNGEILVRDVNLKEDQVVLTSQTYSVDSRETTFLNKKLIRPRFWDKEPKDDGTVNYKPLDKRFHFLKQILYENPFTLESEIFASTQAVTTSYLAGFTSWRNLIAKYYKATRVIINNTKLSEILLNLSPTDINNFDFTNRYHLKQLGADFVVNKIINFTPGSPTRCEMLKINSKEINTENNPPPPSLFITITNAVYSLCELVLTVNTNIQQPFNAVVQAGYSITDPTTGLPTITILYNVIVDANTVTIQTDNLIDGGWAFNIKHQTLSVQSNNTDFINIAGCFMQPPPVVLELISVQTTSIVGNVRNLFVTFETDVPLPETMTLRKVSFLSGEIIDAPILLTGNTFTTTVQHQTPSPYEITIFWGIQLIFEGVTSNQIISIG